ncbi:MAG TPA: CDP-diacylglycerol--serine O-phosphatidyltransferase [Candidatus Hydrogenedentes bacterium]|nr:CDP-diacylglycerol--serine O-phosphatidyltransferase [Candidatus Hydrogenedentota bacterium]
MKLYKLKRSGDRKKRFRNINVLASVMTTMNLYMGVTSILASIGLEFQWAATCILFAIVFDILDGFVARLTRSTSDFGKELDSLCDMVSFGVAPAVLVFMAYLPEGAHLPVSPRTESIVGMTGSYMAIIYAICAALRLARFNTFHADMRESFIGLPSPAAGGTIATFVLFLMYFEQRLDAHALGPFAYVALGPVSVGLALLMVSSVRYPKGRLKAFLLKPRPAFITLAIYAFAIVIIHYAMAKSASLVLFPLMAAYVLFGMGDTIYGRVTGRVQSYSMLDGDEETHETGDDEADHEEESDDGVEAAEGAPVKKADLR